MHDPEPVWKRAEVVRAQHMRGRNLLWTRHVSYRIGAVLALAAERLGLTPNQLTLLSLGFSAAGAALVVAIEAHTPLTVLAILVLWQIGFGLDCADGLLARMQRRTSAFGAWADQLADFTGHLLVSTSLALHLVRSLGVESTGAVAMTGVIVGSSLLQGFAAAQRDAVFGAQPKGHLISRSPLRWVRPVLDLTDYGIYLAATAAALLVPTALVLVLVASIGLTILSTLAQIVILRRATARPDRLRDAEGG